MAAQIPIKHDPVANEAALEKVRQDKLREVRAGHDGTWVAHPGLVPVAAQVFDAAMRGPNQLDVARDDVRVTAADLLTVPAGEITETGLRTNVDIGIQYLASWLRGVGCVPIYNLMEDAATAEISRSQVWQWVRHGARLADGRVVTEGLVRQVMGEASPTKSLAAELFGKLMTGSEFPEFLTLVAYEHLE